MGARGKQLVQFPLEVLLLYMPCKVRETYPHCSTVGLPRSRYVVLVPQRAVRHAGRWKLAILHNLLKCLGEEALM